MTGTGATHISGSQVDTDCEAASLPGGGPLKGATPSRVLLQHRAPRNIRWHWLRDARRVLVLVASDLATYLALRLLVQTIRGGLLGGRIAESVATLLPVGFLGGWQFAVALILSLFFAGAYGAGDKRRDTSRVVAGVGLAGLLALYASVWQSAFVLVSVQYAVTVSAFTVALAASRTVVDLIVKRVRPRLGVGRAILVLQGEPKNWRNILDLAGSNSEFVLVGSIRLHSGSTGGTDQQLWGLGSVIEEKRADTVLLWGNLSDAEFAMAVDLALASGCRLLAGPRTPMAAGVEPKTVRIDGQPLVELTWPSLRAWQLVIKRLMDVVGAVVGLLLTAPLVVVAALAIRLESRGSVFFRQWRVGRAGKPFEIYKFRSMVSDAEQRVEELRKDSIYRDKRLFKVVDDPRITKVGALLRKSSLDEIPQLLNVLRGDMSFVGPRPPTLSEVALYEAHHYCRFDVKPGITGPWQVNGRSEIVDFEEVVRLDREYIERWSLWLDFRIILLTVPAVLRRTGAF